MGIARISCERTASRSRARESLGQHGEGSAQRNSSHPISRFSSLYPRYWPRALPFPKRNWDMINLLPPLYKRRIKQEQYFRIIVILGIAVLGALISLLLLLTAIRLYVAGLVTTEDPFLSTTQTSGAAQEF